MPRTSTLESPGCPPLRALTFDALGLIKVIEVRDKERGTPKVVDRWGSPDISNGIVVASMDDLEFNPLVAVARKSGLIEVINSINGDVRASITPTSDEGTLQRDSTIIGLHLFRKPSPELESKSRMVLDCTEKGVVSLRSFDTCCTGSSSSAAAKPLKAWSVCSGGIVCSSKVDASENHAIFSGKNMEINLWDMNECSKMWTSKRLPNNSLNLCDQTWFTCSTFLDRNDHRKIVAGTNGHQVRVYDVSARRRPVASFTFRDSPIKAVAEDLDGNRVYVGNACGDLACFDIRAGKLLGCYKGKCSASIRSIVRHPELDVLVSCGLDRYLRFWDIGSRQPLSAVFLKQQLTGVVLDSHFKPEEKVIQEGGVDMGENVGMDEDMMDNGGEEGDEQTLKKKRKVKGVGDDDSKIKKRGKNRRVVVEE